MHVSWLDVGDGFIELQLDGERTFAKLRVGWQEEVPDGLRIVEGRIPDRHYILINPAVDADAVDSRRVGMLRRSQLVRKVAWL